MTRRIRKKVSLRYNIEELRDYVTSKPRSYPAYRLNMLREQGYIKQPYLSRSKAKRMVRNRRRKEALGMARWIERLTEGLLSSPP